MKIDLRGSLLKCRKLRMMNSSIDLNDLRIPPANRLEKLGGTKKGFHSIRINNQWRIIFKWRNGQAFYVEIIDYHKLYDEKS